MTDKKELKDEELGRVTGGAEPTQDPKYQRKTKVRFYYIRKIDLQAIGTINNVSWSETENRYLYWIDHEDIRFTLGIDVHYFPAGSCEVREEDIMYAL